jgi:hypothetical protein
MKPMKKNYLRTFMLLALGTMIISCSKDDSALNRPENNTKMASSDYIDDLPVVIPWSTVYPNEP